MNESLLMFAAKQWNQVRSGFAGGRLRGTFGPLSVGGDVKNVVMSLGPTLWKHLLDCIRLAVGTS